jgi:hypothetical protein
VSPSHGLIKKYPEETVFFRDMDILEYDPYCLTTYST